MIIIILLDIDKLNLNCVIDSYVTYLVKFKGCEKSDNWILFIGLVSRQGH